jgi:hypothetical protein
MKKYKIHFHNGNSVVVEAQNTYDKPNFMYDLSLRKDVVLLSSPYFQCDAAQVAYVIELV